MKKVAIAVLLSTIAIPVFAEDMHMYLGVRAGQAKTSIDNVVLSTDNPTAYGVLIGHTFSSALAVEAEYLNLGEIRAGTGSVETTGISVSGVASLPLGDQFSLFGKLGYAMLSSKPSGSFIGADAKSDDVTYGFGGQFNMGPTTGIRLGWDKYKIEDGTFTGDISLMSVGGVFKF